MEATALPRGIERLVEASEREGFAFLRRLIVEWESGANRFARRGEALFAVYVEDELAGVCGVNVDPFTDCPGVGRIRHLYVASQHRRQGLGTELLRTAVHHAARQGFTEVRLRTDSPAAARFYEHYGFLQSPSPLATHILDLKPLSERSLQKSH